MSSNRRSKGIMVIFSMMFLLFVVLLFFISQTVKVFKSEISNQSDGLYSDDSGSIGVVSVVGPIMTSKKIIEELLIAEKDKNVKAIILRIDSPGGAVGPTQEIYEEIRRIDEEVKPVFASFGSIAASGGYYLGAAARRIFSNAGTLTGSIGVIMQFVDASELFKLSKVKPEVIKAGLYKDIGSMSRPMTGEERSLMNGMIKKVHQQFIRDIEKTRKDKIKGNIIDHAQGQIFSGEEALELGLVDEIAGLWAAGRKIHAEEKLEGDFGLKFIKKKKKFSMDDFLSDIDQTRSNIENFFNLNLEGRNPLQYRYR